MAQAKGGHGKRGDRDRQLVPFVETRAFECRWIEGPSGADARCCGARTDGGSWCAFHREIVFERRIR
jgi:hypothetical protein